MEIRLFHLPPPFVPDRLAYSPVEWVVAEWQPNGYTINRDDRGCWVALEAMVYDRYAADRVLHWLAEHERLAENTPRKE